MKVVVDSNEEWRRCIESSTRCSRDHRHDKHDIPGLDLLKQGPPSLSRDTDIVDSFLERRPERRRNIRSVPDGDHDGHDAFRRDIDCGGASGVTENRRWKDDGKRDERNVIRRERQLCGRERDSEQRSGNGHVRKVNYDHSLDKCHDRPGKHNSGRDKIGDGLIDDETFGRGNYGRERNVEKQPAWMDSSVTSVIGASGPADISDEIQSNQPPVTEKPLDEIQLFRLMMKQEEEKTNSENLKAATPVGAVRTSENERSARGSLSSGAQASHSDSSHISLTSGVPPRTTDFFLDSWKDGSRALSSIVSPSASSVISSGASSNAKVPENLARDESTISRFFPNPLSSENLHSRISYNQRPEDVRDRDADACYPHDHLRSESAVFDFRLSHQLDPQDPAQEIHIQHSLSRPSQDSATALPYDNLSRPLQVPVFDGIGSCEWDLRAEESVGDMKIGLSSDIASFGQRDFSSSPGLAVAKGSRFAKFFDSKGRLKDRLSPVAREQDGWAPLEYVAAGNAHASADENAEGMLATLTRSTQAHSAITEYASDATNNLQRFLNDQHATDNDRTFVPSRNQNGRMVVVESRRDEHVANSPRQFLPLSSYDHIYSSPAPPLGGQSGRCSRSGFQPGPLRNNYTHSPNHGSTKYFVPLAVPGGRSPHLVTESTGFPGMHSGVAPGYPRNTQYTNDIFPQPELYFTSGGVNPSTRISQSGVQHVQASLLNGTNAASDLVHGSPQSAQVVFSQQVNQAQVPMYGMRQHQRLPPHIIPTHLSYQGSSNQSS
ncbi:hypothetical protein SERLA73DRAFT_176006 [Serpula lacrymans var. lacrymans S7.3]|uniref:Uncharacterized protein n=2 Tax=Serpula lacrymans var. lacrymans TaxID=341189 RepID=F8PLX7_SERL3|nr:hypothetical protein SERLA73DRAFT_176006 [Serpula lacrymans var. lacrymans S7.3]